LGEKLKDEDFSHKFLMCLPKKFKTLRTIIFRGGLTSVSPNEILGDVMTDAQYNDSDNEDEEKNDKKEKKEECGIQGIHIIQGQEQGKERSIK
jgi:hypothetical protein